MRFRGWGAAQAARLVAAATLAKHALGAVLCRLRRRRLGPRATGLTRPPLWGVVTRTALALGGVAGRRPSLQRPVSRGVTGTRVESQPRQRLLIAAVAVHPPRLADYRRLCSFFCADGGPVYSDGCVPLLSVPVEWRIPGVGPPARRVVAPRDVSCFCRERRGPATGVRRLPSAAALCAHESREESVSSSAAVALVGASAPPRSRSTTRCGSCGWSPSR